MAVITNQDDDANKKIKSSDRRKRAAAAKARADREWLDVPELCALSEALALLRGGGGSGRDGADEARESSSLAR